MVLRPIRIIWKKLPKHWGYARPERRTITIDSRLDDKTTMDIAIHESIHVLAPYLDEETVNSMGVHIADVLWRMGYRRDDDLSEASRKD